MTLQERLGQRAEFLRAIREYFYQKNIVEVDTPILSQFGNPDPALLNFVATYHGPGKLHQKPLFLITSPEYHMKRLLAAGVEDCYYLGKVFRDGELSSRHNPEFTMLEWYRLGFSLETLMDEIILLVQMLTEKNLAVEFYTYREAFETFLEVNPFEATLDDLLALIKKHNIDLGFTPKDRDEAFDLIVSFLIEPAFDPEKLTLLYHYPASQASLAKIVTDDAGNLVGKRFELYWKGLELANGYEELTDSHEQRIRFENENRSREEAGYRAVPIDEKMLEVLDDLPYCSGVAMGVDRLMMALWGKSKIEEVVPFGLDEA